MRIFGGIERVERKQPESEYLFTTLKGKPLNSRYIQEMVKRKAKQTEVTKNVHPHTLQLCDWFILRKQEFEADPESFGLFLNSGNRGFTHIINEELEREMKFLCGKQVV